MKLWFILIVSLCCILGGLVDAHNLCGNWEPFKDEKCFKVLDNLANYTIAEKACGAQGDARLLSIGSPEEQTFLSQFLFTTSKVVDNVWLGVRTQGGQFKRQDEGILAVYSNWLLGIGPQNRSHTDACVQMNSEDGLTGTWTAVSCSKKNLVVCQRAPLFSLETLKGLVFKMKAEQAIKNTKLEEQAALFQLKNTQLEGKMLEQTSKITQLEATSSLPLGFIYVQLPQESAPSVLWPSMNWTEVSSTYAGVFFRVEGGGAGQFGTIQEENAPKLTYVENTACQVSPRFTCGNINYYDSQAILTNGTWSDHVRTAGSYVSSIEGIDSSKLTRYIDFLRFRHSAGEVRPRNMAVKVWKRTA